MLSILFAFCAALLLFGMFWLVVFEDCGSTCNDTMVKAFFLGT